MVISIQDYLARRRNAVASVPGRLAATAVSRGRAGGRTQIPSRPVLQAVLPTRHEGTPAWAAIAPADLPTLYAEATLV